MKPTKKELYYKKQPIAIRKSEGQCNYKFIIPENYKSLGLKNNKLKKDSEYQYSFSGNCPSEDITDEIRISPKKTYWTVDASTKVESTNPFTKNVTLTMPRMYKGGKNRNKNYKLTSDENVVLNDSALINDDEVYLTVELPGKNKKEVGVDLHTSFINNLDNDFILYTSDKFYSLDTNIDSVIKSKVNEVLKDPQYKDYPDYEKIGKFVNSYMTYDLSYHGKELTPLQIFNSKSGIQFYIIQC